MKFLATVALATTLLCAAESTCTAQTLDPDDAQRKTNMRGDEHQVTTADGVRLHAVRFGRGSHAVIVPNAIYMLDDLKSLTANHSVIFYDLRNRGRSNTVNERAKLERGIHHDVDDLEAIRRHFDLSSFSVVAHSYTGAVAALYAMKYPAHLERFVQIGPPAPDMNVPIAPELQFADAMSREVFVQLQELARQAGSVDPIELCRRSWAVLRPLYVGNPAHASRLSHWGFCENANERNMLAHWNQHILPSLQSLTLTANDFAKARMPALVIHGTRDRSAAYGGGREWARRLPNARLLTIDGAGHVPYIEAPEVTLAAIETFLAGDWPGEALAIAD